MLPWTPMPDSDRSVVLAKLNRMLFGFKPVGKKNSKFCIEFANPVTLTRTDEPEGALMVSPVAEASAAPSTWKTFDVKSEPLRTIAPNE